MVSSEPSEPSGTPRCSRRRLGSLLMLLLEQEFEVIIKDQNVASNCYTAYVAFAMVDQRLNLGTG